MKPEARQAMIVDLLRRRQKCLDMRAAKSPGTGGPAFGRIIERYDRMLRNQGYDIEDQQ
jgi:hypothetical protein